jgi:hypothetical protein
VGQSESDWDGIYRRSVCFQTLPEFEVLSRVPQAKWKVSKILEGSQKQVEEGIENSERVSKQILILHEELGFENWYGTKLEDPVDLASYSISSGAQYVTLDNKIKCLSVAISFLATPPIKL